MASDDAIPPVELQTVTAVGGFAYGVIGADIHVMGDGSPLYILENWHNVDTPDSAWLREMPSRMLNAQFHLTEFVGRFNELAELERWRDSASRFAVRWLHGVGGIGKTRLASKFAIDSIKVGWKVVTATSGFGIPLPPPGSQDLRLGGSKGLLLIVDYADRWRFSSLTWLLSNALLHQRGVPTRVLFLARSADSWPAISGSLANLQASTSVQNLTALAVGTEDQNEMFRAAVDGYARHYPAADTDSIVPPWSPTDENFSLTLAIHVAALVAVDAKALGNATPIGMDGLTIYLLNREHLHWTTLYQDGLSDDYTTPPPIMNRIVFIAALTGSVIDQLGKTILERIHVEGTPKCLLHDHLICYPSQFDEGALEPLYPDRLAEDFIALTLPGHQSEYPAQSWANSTMLSIIYEDCDRLITASEMRRAITFLAAAAQRWPHVCQGYLVPLVSNHPQLAVLAGNEALATIAGLPEMTIDVLESIEDKLPEYWDSDVAAGVAVLARRLAEHRLTYANVDQAADIFVKLSMCVFYAGYFDESFDYVARGAILLQRLVQSTGTPRHMTRLAKAYEHLSTLFSKMGRGDEALSAAEKATELRSQGSAAFLNDSDAEAHVAMSLAEEAQRLAGIGKQEEALQAAERSLAISRALAEQHPGRYDSKFVQSLTAVAILNASLGRPEAVDLTAEALKIQRKLSKQRPEEVPANLAGLLNNYANHLEIAGRFEEAAVAADESIEVWRQVARRNPAVYDEQLAVMLSNAMAKYLKVDRPQDAWEAATESAEILKRISTGQPPYYLPVYLGTVLRIAREFYIVEAFSEATYFVERGLDIAEEIGDAGQNIATKDLVAEAHWLFAEFKGRLNGDEEKVVVVAREAIRMYAELAKASPPQFTEKLRLAQDTVERITNSANSSSG